MATILLTGAVLFTHKHIQLAEDRQFSIRDGKLQMAEIVSEGLCTPDFIAEFHGQEQLIRDSEAPQQLIAGPLLRSLVPGDLSPLSTDPDSALLSWRQPEEA